MMPRILFIVLLSLLAKNAQGNAQRQRIDHEALRAIMREKFVRYGVQCLRDNPLTIEDVIDFKNNRFPKNPNAPCFMACVTRELGILDDEGNYNYTEVLRKTKRVLSQKEQANYQKFVSGCDSVNDVNVDDGEEGCERAKLIYNLPHQTCT
ncbi:PBP/GOBP family domain-containing protein [Phthorimaea operculella]|nr:PBP/GOBP family domain-containing protein [Phthorimaea operculella]